MRSFKTLGIAGGFVAAALVGGTLINAVFAAQPAPGTGSTAANTADKAAYCDTWKQAFADALGVSVDKLAPAAKAATIKTIDAALAAGDITSDVATRLKAAVNAADGNACRFLGHPFLGFGQHAAKVELGADLVSAAATALGMEPSALIQELRGGKSLKDVASAQGKNYGTVSKAVHDAAKKNLDALVKAGTIEQAREDTLLKGLDAALASGDFPKHFPRPGRGFGFPGFGHDEPSESSPSSAT